MCDENRIDNELEFKPARRKYTDKELNWFLALIVLLILFVLTSSYVSRVMEDKMIARCTSKVVAYNINGGTYGSDYFTTYEFELDGMMHQVGFLHEDQIDYMGDLYVYYNPNDYGDYYIDGRVFGIRNNANTVGNWVFERETVKHALLGD